MPKPELIKSDAILESQIIKTLLAGLHEWRPDLNYPESHSDMQACVRGLLRMFHVERRPLTEPLRIECRDCGGIGELISYPEGGIQHRQTCKHCKGKGHVYG